MANQVEQVLIEPLYQALQKERFVTLVCLDENKKFLVTSISWVFAKNTNTILFSIDQRSRIVRAIQENPQVVISVIANESVYSIHGNAHVKIETLEGIPLKLSAVEIQVTEVFDSMFYGSKMSVEPEYEKTYDKNAAAKLDQQVMDALRAL
jgi:hypothetical protein